MNYELSLTILESLLNAKEGEQLVIGDIVFPITLENELNMGIAFNLKQEYASFIVQAEEIISSEKISVLQQVLTQTGNSFYKKIKNLQVEDIKIIEECVPYQLVITIGYNEETELAFNINFLANNNVLQDAELVATNNSLLIPLSHKLCDTIDNYANSVDSDILTTNMTINVSLNERVPINYHSFMRNTSKHTIYEMKDCMKLLESKGLLKQLENEVRLTTDSKRPIVVRIETNGASYHILNIGVFGEN